MIKTVMLKNGADGDDSRYFHGKTNGSNETLKFMRNI